MQSQPENFQSAERQQETRPAYLYIFTHTPFYGAATSYHLTNFDQNLVVTNLPAAKGANPQTFIACQVGHSEVEQSSEQNAPTTDISVALNDSAESTELKKYFISPIPNRIDVTVVRVNSQALPGEVDWEEDCFTVFRGIKVNVTLSGQTLVLQALSLMLQEDGRVPRFYYQKQCQHDFGRAPCPVNLDTAPFRLNTTIAALLRVNRTVDIADTLINGETITNTTFIGGRFEVLSAGNVVNVITIGAVEILPAGAGTRLRLSWWDSSLAVAQAVRIKKGCLKIVDACIAHGGIADFGGTPYIPVNNPSIDGINT